ncbi:MAG: hypothetical protein AAF437_11450 [Pseudomonadota bacterium]
MVLSRDLARELAVLSPTDVLPYEVALANAVRTGDLEIMNEFAERALARQPRSLAAHLHLFQSAAQRGNYPSLIARYERLVKLRSLNPQLLTRALIGVFRNAEDWSPLMAYLNDRPHSGDMIVSQLLLETELPQKIDQLISKYPSAQPAYLSRKIRERALPAAYQAWLSFADLSEIDQTALPFNGSFTVRGEPPPFNWTVHSSRAELQSDGGLYVSYAGLGTPLIASQIFSIAPGSYQLTTKAIGRMPANGGSLEWFISCAEEFDHLATAEIVLTKISEQQVFVSDVHIPDAACQFVSLELRGRSGAFPKSSRIVITSVDLTITSEQER